MAAVLLVLWALACLTARAEESEWTVLLYFCGSDLESKYGFATCNLEEIANVALPQSYVPEYARYYQDDMETGAAPKVNVLIQTGGSLEWHAQSLGMDVSPNHLQRWRFRAAAGSQTGESYELLETLPLDSMADPGTLTEFIRWGVKTCPAKKYALVLWDHGGGAKTGLFIDELYRGDVMYLYELRQALAEGGARFELVVIDACLMANIETAWALSGSADWLVASEEVAPGQGTAIDKWLGALYAHPQCDGQWLGRCVCDMTEIRYCDEDDALARRLLTWSLIDLSKIDRLVEITGRFFQGIGEALESYPTLIKNYADCIYNAYEFSDGTQNMRDLASVVYNQEAVHVMNPELRADMLDALADAVVYNVHGSGRSETRGLSFCYAADFEDSELEIYARNFPQPQYLAWLDAINSWNAPDWVYDTAKKLPEVDTIGQLQITMERCMSPGGMPALYFSDSASNLKDVYYRLYRLNAETGQVLYLGRTDCVREQTEDGKTLWRASDPMHWPAVEGTLCCIDLVQEQHNKRLYNIPVQINSQAAMLRCGRNIWFSEDGGQRMSNYEIYGVWEGYDADSDMMNRSVKPLAMLAGQDYRILYPVDLDDDAKAFEASDMKTMYRALTVKEMPLPAGTYYLEYEIVDIFMQTTLIDRIVIHWDGETMTFPEELDWIG